MQRQFFLDQELISYRYSSSSPIPLRFDDSSPMGKPSNIYNYLYCQKLESMTYIFAADSMGLSSCKFWWWAPKNASFLQ